MLRAGFGRLAQGSAGRLRKQRRRVRKLPLPVSDHASGVAAGLEWCWRGPMRLPASVLITEPGSAQRRLEPGM